jgi:hypothetical protein
VAAATLGACLLARWGIDGSGQPAVNLLGVALAAGLAWLLAVTLTRHPIGQTLMALRGVALDAVSEARRQSP